MPMYSVKFQSGIETLINASNETEARHIAGRQQDKVISIQKVGLC